MEQKDEKRISLRIAPEFHDRITEAARGKNLSINGYIITALMWYLEIGTGESLQTYFARLEAKLNEIAGEDQRINSVSHSLPSQSIR